MNRCQFAGSCVSSSSIYGPVTMLFWGQCLQNTTLKKVETKWLLWGKGPSLGKCNNYTWIQVGEHIPVFVDKEMILMILSFCPFPDINKVVCFAVMYEIIFYFKWPLIAKLVEFAKKYCGMSGSPCPSKTGVMLARIFFKMIICERGPQRYGEGTTKKKLKWNIHEMIFVNPNTTLP